MGSASAQQHELAGWEVEATTIGDTGLFSGEAVS